MVHTRRELSEHVGGSPSATERALIERAVNLTVRIALMDEKFAETAVQTDHDSRTYLAWSASLVRTLSALGTEPKTAKRKTLNEHIAERTA